MTPASTTFRADLHVHSSHSNAPIHKGMRFFGSAECYTTPDEVYAAARARGMDFVTITDHNTLEGAKAIAHLPGTFLSTEFDAWFPEDRCRVHVVALGIDEATFADALPLRESIYDLVGFLRAAGVVHYIAHPLFDMTGKMTVDHVEKLLLLFDLLEGRNGARSVRCNGLLRELVTALTPELIEDMAERQGVEPCGETPWRKALTGGSDDHSGLFIAGAHTTVDADRVGGQAAGTQPAPAAPDVTAFLAAVAGGHGVPAGEDGDSLILAHSIYATGFWRLREILRLDEPPERRRAFTLITNGFGRVGRDVPIPEKTLRGARSVAPGLYRDGDGRGPAWEHLFEERIASLLETPGGTATIGARELDRRIFEVATRIADDVTALHLQPVLDPAQHVGLKRMLQAAAALGMIQLLEVPYYIAWLLQSRDRALQEELRTLYLPGDAAARRPRVAVFAARAAADGDAGALRALAHSLADGTGYDVLTSTPGAANGGDGLRDFAAVAWRPSRAGAPPALVVPPVLEMMDYLDEHEYTAVHALRSDELGLLGVLAAKLLHLPLTGSSGGVRGRHRSRRYARWFYGLLDEVLVPDEAVRAELVALGLDPWRVRVAGPGALAHRADAPPPDWRPAARNGRERVNGAGVPAAAR